MQESVQSQQHPTEITCQHCKTAMRRTGEFLPSGRVYTCFCGSTTRIVPVKSRKVAPRRKNSMPHHAA